MATAPMSEMPSESGKEGVMSSSSIPLSGNDVISGSYYKDTISSSEYRETESSNNPEVSAAQKEAAQGSEGGSEGYADSTDDGQAAGGAVAAD